MSKTRSSTALNTTLVLGLTLAQAMRVDHNG